MRGLLTIFLIGRDLSYNQLTGEIPFNVGFLQVATLYVPEVLLTCLINTVLLQGFLVIYIHL